MSRELLKNLSQALLPSVRISAPPGVTVIGSGREPASLRQVVPQPRSPRRVPAPIVRLPVGAGRNAPAPRAVATADLKVKLFRGRHVEEERYTAILNAVSDAPAALLAALAEAAGEVEELGRESEAAEQLIMHITIRWQRPDRDLTVDVNAERSA